MIQASEESESDTENLWPAPLVIRKKYPASADHNPSPSAQLVLQNNHHHHNRGATDSSDQFIITRKALSTPALLHCNTKSIPLSVDGKYCYTENIFTKSRQSDKVQDAQSNRSVVASAPPSFLSSIAVNPPARAFKSLRRKPIPRKTSTIPCCICWELHCPGSLQCWEFIPYPLEESKRTRTNEGYLVPQGTEYGQMSYVEEPEKGFLPLQRRRAQLLEMFPHLLMNLKVQQRRLAKAVAGRLEMIEAKQFGEPIKTGSYEEEMFSKLVQNCLEAEKYINQEILKLDSKNEVVEEHKKAKKQPSESVLTGPDANTKPAKHRKLYDRNSDGRVPRLLAVNFPAYLEEEKSKNENPPPGQENMKVPLDAEVKQSTESKKIPHVRTVFEMVSDELRNPRIVSSGLGALESWSEATPGAVKEMEHRSCRTKDLLADLPRKSQDIPESVKEVRADVDDELSTLIARSCNALANAKGKYMEPEKRATVDFHAAWMRLDISDRASEAIDSLSSSFDTKPEFVAQHFAQRREKLPTKGRNKQCELNLEPSVLAFKKALNSPTCHVVATEISTEKNEALEDFEDAASISLYEDEAPTVALETLENTDSGCESKPILEDLNIDEARPVSSVYTFPEEYSITNEERIRLCENDYHSYQATGTPRADPVVLVSPVSSSLCSVLQVSPVSSEVDSREIQDHSVEEHDDDDLFSLTDVPKMPIQWPTRVSSMVALKFVETDPSTSIPYPQAPSEPVAPHKHTPSGISRPPVDKNIGVPTPITLIPSNPVLSHQRFENQIFGPLANRNISIRTNHPKLSSRPALPQRSTERAVSGVHPGRDDCVSRLPPKISPKSVLYYWRGDSTVASSTAVNQDHGTLIPPIPLPIKPIASGVASSPQQQDASKLSEVGMDLSTLEPPSGVPTVQSAAHRCISGSHNPITNDLEVQDRTKAVQEVEKPGHEYERYQQNELNARNFLRAVHATADGGVLVVGHNHQELSVPTASKLKPLELKTFNATRPSVGIEIVECSKINQKQEIDEGAVKIQSNEHSDFGQQLKGLQSIDGVIPAKVGPWLGSVDEKSFTSTHGCNEKIRAHDARTLQSTQYFKAFETNPALPQTLSDVSKATYRAGTHRLIAAPPQTPATRKNIAKPSPVGKKPGRLRSSSTNAIQHPSQRAEKLPQAIPHEIPPQPANVSESITRPTGKRKPSENQRSLCSTRGADYDPVIPHNDPHPALSHSTPKASTTRDRLKDALIRLPAKALTRKVEKERSEIYEEKPALSPLVNITAQEALAAKARVEQQREQKRLEQEHRARKELADGGRAFLRNWYWVERQEAGGCHGMDENMRHPSQMNLLPVTTLPVDHFMKGCDERRQRHFELAQRGLNGKVTLFNDAADEVAYKEWQAAHPELVARYDCPKLFSKV
jgi:hypothetical protein